jgi:hypothetical protein
MGPSTQIRLPSGVAQAPQIPTPHLGEIVDSTMNLMVAHRIHAEPACSRMTIGAGPQL